MSQIQRIEEDFQKALKADNRETVSVLRMLKSALINKKIEKKRKELIDNDISEVILHEVKMRKEACLEYAKGRRDDMVEKEKEELKILKKYLPKPLRDNELQRLVDRTVKELKAQSLKDMGKVMKQVLGKAKGRADGKRTSEMVRETLSKIENN